MYARLGFSLATIIKPDILVVDEILAVGDYAFQQKSRERMDRMLSDGTTLLYVSHAIDDIKRTCKNAIWLEKGKLMMIGEVNEVCDAYLKSLGA